MTKRNITRIQPGDKYGRWTVLKEGPRDKHNNRTALCRCSCENKTERTVILDNMKRGLSTSCGCAAQQKVPAQGEVYGRLTVVEEAERSAAGNRRWLCECSCGTLTKVLRSPLIIGRTRSCGCLRRDANSECHTTHGLSGTNEYARSLRAANPERYRATRRRFYARHSESEKASHRKWTKENAEHATEYNARRRAEKLNAIPSWHKEETKTYVKTLKKEARRLEKETGVKYHIDHVVPLKSAIVSGLHVKDNLQLLTQTENLKKYNKVWPHMPT